MKDDIIIKKHNMRQEEENQDNIANDKYIKIFNNIDDINKIYIDDKGDQESKSFLSGIINFFSSTKKPENVDLPSVNDKVTVVKHQTHSSPIQINNSLIIDDYLSTSSQSSYVSDNKYIGTPSSESITDSNSIIENKTHVFDGSNGDKIVVSLDENNTVNIKISNQTFNLKYDDKSNVYQINKAFADNNNFFGCYNNEESINNAHIYQQKNIDMLASGFYDDINNKKTVTPIVEEVVVPQLISDVKKESSYKENDDNVSSLSDDSFTDDDFKISRKHRKNVNKIGVIAISTVALIGGTFINKLFS